MSTLVFQTLELTDFKAFTGNVTFGLHRPPGLYFITGINHVAPELGANGTGKSTLWDGLLWALWGRTGRDARPANAIKPWSGEGRPAASLRFCREGVNHKITRTRSPNALIHEGPEGIRDIAQEDVPRILGMSEAMFRRTLVLGQFGTFFLDLGPEEQGRMFTEALSLDVWLAASEKASASFKEHDRKRSAFEVGLATTAKLIEENGNILQDAKNEKTLWDENHDGDVTEKVNAVGKLVKALREIEAQKLKEPTAPDRTKLLEMKERSIKLRADYTVAENLVKQAEQSEYNASAVSASYKAKKCPTCGQSLKDHVDKLKEAERAVITANKAKTEALWNLDEILRKRSKLDTQYAEATANIQGEAEEYDTRKQAYDKWVEDKRKLANALRSEEAMLERLQNEQNPHDARVKRSRLRVHELRAEKHQTDADLETAKQAAASAEFWTSGFKEIRLNIVDQVLVELEMAASRHAASLGLNDWQIQFRTERETKKGDVTYAFQTFLIPPGMDAPVKWESYSGGESQRLQLAIAFALSEILLARAGVQPNIEVLDEPTRGLSQQGVTDLLDHLRERALENGRAAFFVDHHSLDKGVFDGVITLEKTAKGVTIKGG